MANTLLSHTNNRISHLEVVVAKAFLMEPYCDTKSENMG